MPDLQVPYPEGAYGSYVICDVCGWEDDQVQLANPVCGGGANSESLIQAQTAVLARYPVGVHVAEGTRRPRWRPLNDAERRFAETERAEKYWKNRDVVTLHECYWMRSEALRSAG